MICHYVHVGMVQAWVGPFVTPLKLGGMCPTDKSRVKKHNKSTNHLTNTITMVVELLAPPAVWIWWTHAARGVGGLAHVHSNAAIEAIR